MVLFQSCVWLSDFYYYCWISMASIELYSSHILKLSPSQSGSVVPGKKGAWSQTKGKVLRQVFLKVWLMGTSSLCQSKLDPVPCPGKRNLWTLCIRIPWTYFLLIREKFSFYGTLFPETIHVLWVWPFRVGKGPCGEKWHLQEWPLCLGTFTTNHLM